MKKIFNAPEIEIMHLGAQDIITTSVTPDRIPQGTAPEHQEEDW